MTECSLPPDGANTLRLNDGHYQLSIQSSTDGYCAFSAVASLFKKGPHDLQELRYLFDAISGRPGGFRPADLVGPLAKHDVPVLTLTQFYDSFS
jgi:hypothetical protein